jgi:polar amino acid transport system substrate-binding protein
MSPVRRVVALLLCVLVSSCASNVPSHPTASPAAVAPAPASLLKLRLVSSRFPPFTDTPEGTHLALDLVASALARVGYEASTQIVPAASLDSELREGRFDGSAALWLSEERQEFLLYSNPYLENRLLLVGPKGSAVSAQSLLELKGKKVGVVEGYAYGDEIEASKDPVLVRGVSTEENLRSLLRGELDYVLAEALTVHHLLEHSPKQARERLEVSPHALVRRSLHLAVRKDYPDAQAIIERFNQELKGMLHEGAYHDALQVSWIRADLDGDGRPEWVPASQQVGENAPTDAYDLVSVASTPGTGQPSDEPVSARFVIKGVAYDSWEAVPSDYKTQSNDLGAKPRSMRLKVFEF